MPTRNKITKAIFGFKDEETGEQLRLFFKKHTGRDIDFNNIKHYKNGFKLLLFSIPLDTIDIIGITAAGCAPSYVKRFSGLNDFIKWYENDFSQRIESKDIEKASIFNVKKTIPLDYSFIQQYKELNIRTDIEFDPFPFINKHSPIKPLVRGESAATIILYNGLYARVPMKTLKEHILVLNTNIFINQKHKSWIHFLNYLGIKETENGVNVTRLTPDDNCIRYDIKYDRDVEYICNFYNYRLNKEQPLDYPSKWFEVTKMIVPKIGGPLGIDGKTIAAYMFAAPRCYFKYFSSKKTSKEIAEDIFYDNL